MSAELIIKSIMAFVFLFISLHILALVIFDIRFMRPLRAATNGWCEYVEQYKSRIGFRSSEDEEEFARQFKLYSDSTSGILRISAYVAANPLRVYLPTQYLAKCVA